LGIGKQILKVSVAIVLGIAGLAALYIVFAADFIPRFLAQHGRLWCALPLMVLLAGFGMVAWRQIRSSNK
jgi:hypothetical protein